MPTVSVIIPTTCEQRRAGSLKRAIASASTQENVRVNVIIVVNGNRFDPVLFETLKKNKDLKVLYQSQGSAPLAQRLGRSSVETAFFSFLDDDDEYLPNALQSRFKPFLTDNEIDFVASNGFRMVEGIDHIAMTHVDAIREDPLLALCEENWLASCGGLFRSSSVTPEYFHDPAPFLEWTYLAYRLTTSLKMVFVDIQTFRIHDSTFSLSKSNAYRHAEAGVLKRILALNIPPRVQTLLLRKIGKAYHALSSHYAAIGGMRLAWRYHLMSLAFPGRWNYILYSRRLLFRFLDAKPKLVE